MKKVILFMAGILASMMLNAQSRWSVTPEAGLVVNKENEGTSVTLGFKAGAGVFVIALVFAFCHRQLPP